MSRLNALLVIVICLLQQHAFAGADSALLRKYVQVLTDTPGYRNCYNLPRLNVAADYINTTLRNFGGRVYQTVYDVHVPRQGHALLRNVIAAYGPEHAPVIVIGAHYDVCGSQMGADDNASGVAALLELARMLGREDASSWRYRVELVAYSSEEPPFFDGPEMGSAVHAKRLADSGVSVKGMVSLEMIGYYQDGKHTQDYPIGILKWFYGSRANYITVVHKLHKGRFVRSFQRGFKKGRGVRVKKFGAPRSLAGINLSDHFNYWDHGWPALMITNTSFYRNANYHRPGDTPETLDYVRMAAVTDKVFRALMRQLR